MAPNVPYSMNRKNRWNEIAAASLLANNSAAGQPNVDVAVVERVYTAKSKCVRLRPHKGQLLQLRT